MSENFTRFLRQHITSSIFWKPHEELYSEQAEHLPFLFWLVEACNPKTIVQLGANNPISYYGYCYSVKNLFLESRCYIIDLINGESQTKAGCYSCADILPAFCKDEFKSFSTLVHSEIAHAHSRFPDNTVDILHLSGIYSSQDISEVLKCWEEKLSDHSIVLIDNLNTIDNGLGVQTFWNELKLNFQTFAFWHAKGLGVVIKKNNGLQPLKHFFTTIQESEIAVKARQLYIELGLQLNAHLKKIELSRTQIAIQEQCAALTQEINLLKRSLSWRITQPLREMFARFPLLKKGFRTLYRLPNIILKKKILLKLR